MSIVLWQVIILATVQGLAELLPISSSAHVVVAEKLMGLDPSAPQMTLLLVMLHTGTMCAVIVYFWDKWRCTYFQSAVAFRHFAVLAVVATAITGVVGAALIKLLDRIAFGGRDGDVEQLFSHLELIAPALAVVGVLILLAGIAENKQTATKVVSDEISPNQAGLIGVVQGVCLVFRGFSRSGATISTGMIAGVSKESAEKFSFALAVILTPPAVAREVFRLIEAGRLDTAAHLASAFMPSMIGGCCAFFSGLVALRWLSSWLASGHWYLFGIYCVIASATVGSLHLAGY
jgi:undecaprenyl-diphosphatase